MKHLLRLRHHPHCTDGKTGVLRGETGCLFLASVLLKCNSVNMPVKSLTTLLHLNSQQKANTQCLNLTQRIPGNILWSLGSHNIVFFFFPSGNHLLHLAWGLVMINFHSQLESRITWNHPEVRLQGLLLGRFKGKLALSVSNAV